MADRKIRAGYYRRYDGKLIYLVTAAEDAETGEETVILRSYSFSEVPQYFTMSKKSFCAFVEVNSERKKSAERDAEYDSRVYQSAPTYLAYAKELCESYRFDSAKYRLCMNEKRYAAITRSDFAKLKEDIQFLDNALKTVLQDHQAYFQERFVDGLSIRKYAEAHQLNRGSVDYLQKKLLTALAQLLKERDEADGICRLRPKTT